LDDTKGSRDPHVERLIDAFALLSARTRRKIDDEFPEVVESLLNLLYPHYLRPVPAMAVAQFQFGARQGLPMEPVRVPKGSILTSRPAGGVECTSQPAYPVTIWPLKVTKASLVSIAALNATDAPNDSPAARRIQIDGLGQAPAARLEIPY